MVCRECFKFTDCPYSTRDGGTQYYGSDLACNNVEELCDQFKDKTDLAAFANEFIDKLSKENIYYGDHIINTIRGLAEGKSIENIPSIEGIKKAKYGEWVVCGDGEYVPFVCTSCSKTTSWYHKQTANFCPNCGAEMLNKEAT